MWIDAEAREKIQHDLQHTYLVEASAGTGKTTLLVERILHILRQSKANLSEVVAITFTEKAAAELKSRVRQKLEEYAGNEAWAQRALAQIEHSPITTIHGFCAAILRAWPGTNGPRTDFVVADEAAQTLFYRDTWRSWLDAQVRQDHPTLRRLLYLGVASDNIAVMAQQLALYRDLLPASFSPQWQAVSLAAWRAMFGQQLTACSSLLSRCRDEADAGYQHVQLLLRKWPYLEALDEDALSRRLIYGIGVRDRDGNQKNWEPPDSLKEIKSRLKGIKEQTLSIHSALVHNLAQETMAWLRDFLVFYQQQKQARNWLDFTDILTLTRDLVKNDKSVRAMAAAAYRYLLVDEFQDTDPLQVEILFFLAEQQAMADAWQQVTVVPGKLFLVGDPKQSIYRFRRADIEIYEEVKQHLGPESLILITQNFRTRPAIISWVNDVFSDLICPPEDGAYQPAYAPLYAARGDAPERPALLFMNAQEPPRTNGDIPDEDGEEEISGEERRGGHKIAEIVAQEADVIAAMLCRIEREKWPVEERGRMRPFAWSDAAILLRRFSYLEVFEEALSRRHIPYEVMGAKPFYDRLEIKSLASLLRALAEPCHTQALVAALRSPIFAVSDEEIFSYRHAYGAIDYRCPQAGDTLLGRILCLLQDLHRQIDTMPAPALLEKIFAATGLPLTFVAMWQGEQRLANLTKVIDLAYHFRRRERDDFRSFVYWLSAMEKAEGQEESVSEHAADTPAVRIFSIHRAKGLEFPVVFLGDLAGKPRQLPEIIVHRTAGTLAIKMRGRQDIKTSEYENDKEWEKKRTNAEEIRLLYVAMTRARDYLLLPLAARGYGYLKLLAPFVPDAETDSPLVCQVATAIAAVQSLSRLPQSFTLPVAPWATEATSASQQQSQSEQERIRQQAGADQPRWLPDMFSRQAPGKCETAVRKVLLALEPLAGDDMFLPLEIERLLARQAELLALSHEESTRARRLISHAVASPLLARAVRSKKKFREIPWRFRLGGLWLQGTIDLCFEERDGLVLVHYNAATADKSQVAAMAAEYRLEATVHALAVQEIARGKVKENFLLFLDSGIAIPCPLTPDSFTEAVHLCTSLMLRR